MLAFLRYSGILYRYDVNSLTYADSFEPNTVLTYDDGPHPVYTPKVLKILGEKNIKAVFFVLGKNVAVFPDIVDQMLENGHEIALHGYGHIDYSKATREEITLDIQLSIDALLKKTKVRRGDLRFFRPPFGFPWRIRSFYRTSDMLRILKELDLTLALWSYDTKDIMLALDEVSKEEIYSEIRNTYRGGICLMHDIHKHVADMSEMIIQLGKEKCLNFSGLSYFQTLKARKS
jgi:peptidoglycan/xylan/chitin deacetylase (PgdA/CDA1 family)